MKINIFLPKYIFWYLFSLLIWRLLVDDLKKIKGILILSILLGLYIGGIPDADRFMAISRTIAFFPYFLMGVFMSEEEILKIRKVSKFCTIIATILLSCAVIVLHIKNLIPVKAYENIQCYTASGMGNIQGIIVRIFSYGVGMTAVICMINLISDKKRWYTNYGSRTAVIYVASAFSVKFLYKFIMNDWTKDYLVQHPGAGIITAVVVTVVTILIFGTKIFSDMYMKVNQAIGKILIKS